LHTYKTLNGDNLKKNGLQKAEGSEYFALKATNLMLIKQYFCVMFILESN